MKSLYKFGIGDQVHFTVDYHPWVDSFEATGKIIDFGYFLNNIPTYIIKVEYDKFPLVLPETRLSLNKKE